MTPKKEWKYFECKDCRFKSGSCIGEPEREHDCKDFPDERKRAVSILKKLNKRWSNNKNKWVAMWVLLEDLKEAIKEIENE